MKKIIPFLVFMALVSCNKVDENSCIRVDDSVITAYFDTDDESIMNSWAVQTRTPYVGTPQDSRTRERIRHVYDIVMSYAAAYRPVNGRVMDMLFPSWRKEGIALCMIVGCPLQYDAFSATSPDGKETFILNLASLAGYGVDDETLIASLENIFAHEFTHIIMKNRGLGKPEAGDYLSSLNNLTYHEGFAHLLSHDGANIRDVDWKAIREEHFEPCRIMLENAMAEEDPEQQSVYIRKAGTGYYYDKFAAISSMLYLSKIYEKKGVRGLKRELRRGPDKICKRIVRSKK